MISYEVGIILIMLVSVGSLVSAALIAAWPNRSPDVEIVYIQCSDCEEVLEMDFSQIEIRG